MFNLDPEHALKNLLDFQPRSGTSTAGMRAAAQQEIQNDYKELIRRAGQFGAFLGSATLTFLLDRFIGGIDAVTSTTAFRDAMSAVRAAVAKVRVDSVEESPPATALSSANRGPAGTSSTLSTLLTGEQLFNEAEEALKLWAEPEIQESAHRLREEAMRLMLREQQEHWVGSFFIFYSAQTMNPDSVKYEMYQTLLSCPYDVADMTRKVQEAARDAWAYRAQLLVSSATSSPPSKSAGKETEHTEDFMSVRWCGTPYTFTPTEAACVKVLWEYFDRGMPEITWETIRIKAKVSARSLADIFRKAKSDKSGKEYNPAWGTMIVQAITPA